MTYIHQSETRCTACGALPGLPHAGGCSTKLNIRRAA